MPQAAPSSTVQSVFSDPAARVAMALTGVRDIASLDRSILAGMKAEGAVTLCEPFEALRWVGAPAARDDKRLVSVNGDTGRCIPVLSETNSNPINRL